MQTFLPSSWADSVYKISNKNLQLDSIGPVRIIWRKCVKEKGEGRVFNDSLLLLTCRRRASSAIKYRSRVAPAAAQTFAMPLSLLSFEGSSPLLY